MDDCEWTMSDDVKYNLRLVVEYKASKEMAESAKKRADKLKRERRVSKTFDAANCEEWAKTTGLWDQVSEVVELLSEDKVLALAWDEPEIRAEIERFYLEKVTWAFKL